MSKPVKMTLEAVDNRRSARLVPPSTNKGFRGGEWQSVLLTIIDQVTGVFDVNNSVLNCHMSTHKRGGLGLSPPITINRDIEQRFQYSI